MRSVNTGCFGTPGKAPRSAAVGMEIDWMAWLICGHCLGQYVWDSSLEMVKFSGDLAGTGLLCEHGLGRCVRHNRVRVLRFACELTVLQVTVSGA